MRIRSEAVPPSSRNVEPPAGLNWDLWCGPAPLRPFNGDPGDRDGGGIHPRGVRSYLGYANGTLGDWGIHWMDQILWVTGEKWPRKIASYGGRPIKGPPVLTAEEQTSDAPDHLAGTSARRSARRPGGQQHRSPEA